MPEIASQLNARHAEQIADLILIANDPDATPDLRRRTALRLAAEVEEEGRLARRVFSGDQHARRVLRERARLARQGRSIPPLRVMMARTCVAPRRVHGSSRPRVRR